MWEQLTQIVLLSLQRQKLGLQRLKVGRQSSRHQTDWGEEDSLPSEGRVYGASLRN